MTPTNVNGLEERYLVSSIEDIDSAIDINDMKNQLSCADEMYSLLPHNHLTLYELLMKLNFPKDSKIVEVGVCYGRTAILMSRVANKKGWDYHGVDCFVLCSESAFRNAIDSTGLPYTLHVGSSNSIPCRGYPEVQWNNPIHFLLIDGSHTDPHITEDCKKWLPWVVPGGIVAFDDWNEEEIPNAHSAIRVAGRKHTEGWTDLGWNGRLKMFQKPGDSTTNRILRVDTAHWNYEITDF